MKAYPAIAIIETNNIATGIQTGDAMAKKSPIAILKTGIVSKGKYLILIAGSVASVDEAFIEGLKIAGDDCIDSMLLPDVHPRVLEAILGKKVELRWESLGTVETESIATNIRSADAAIKGAAVEIIEIHLGDGFAGKAYTLYNGKVEEVETAIDIASQIISSKGCISKISLIPSLDSGMIQQLNGNLRFSNSRLTQLSGGETDVTG